MRRVLFDDQIFSDQEFGGVSRYFNHLIEQLNDIGIFQCKNSTLYSNNIYLNDKRPSLFATNSSKSLVNFGRKLSKGINRFNSIRLLRQGNYDLFHPTNFNPYFLSYLKKPFVLTVYDMITERYPEYYNLKYNESKNKYELCCRAQKIIAISESTKVDLIELFGIRPDKIEVVHLNSDFDNPNIVELNLPNRYLLYVGRRSHYKNFHRFTEAISTLLNGHSDLHVVCTGNPFTMEENEFLKSLNIQTKFIHIKPNESELFSVYNRALAFVFPSLYEGFGLPIIESFRADCPVLLANTSSLKEVGAKAAIYFNPLSVEDIRKKVTMILDDHNLREKLKIAGRIRSNDFSWEKMSYETQSVYEELT